MSDISETVLATIVIADFANVDTAGKANLIGAGIRVMPLRPDTGLTLPFGLYINLESHVPSEGDAPAIEILLTDASGDVILVPQAPGTEPQAIRISQNIVFQSPTAFGINIPRGSLPSSAAFAIGFPGGLPLAGGLTYQWRVQVDHDVVATYSFFVAALPQGPVVG